MTDIIRSLRANIARAISDRTSLEVGGGVFSHDELRVVLAGLDAHDALAQDFERMRLDRDALLGDKAQLVQTIKDLRLKLAESNK